jgi:hypothetical protein
VSFKDSSAPTKQECRWAGRHKLATSKPHASKKMSRCETAAAWACVKPECVSCYAQSYIQQTTLTGDSMHGLHAGGTFATLASKQRKNFGTLCPTQAQLMCSAALTHSGLQEKARTKQNVWHSQQELLPPPATIHQRPICYERLDLPGVCTGTIPDGKCQTEHLELGAK